MFTKRLATDPTPLDIAIGAVLQEMSVETSDTKEYAAMADQLVKLMKLKKEVEPSRRVSPDVLATIVANLAGIAMIIGYERANVITSKAIGFVAKLKS